MSDLTEKHFQMCIYLMLFFFCIYVGLEMLSGLKILTTSTAASTAHDYFILFGGFAAGMFRGMMPQKP